MQDEKDEEWHKARLGMVTGSIMSKFVVSDKKNGFKLSTSQTTESLIYKIAWERLVKNGDLINGLSRLNISSKEMEHGNFYESQAIALYEQITFNKVARANEFVHLNDCVGGTPDGFVGDDGIVEVKCPWNGGNHLKTLLNGEVYNSDHMYQIQSYLWITGRKWCDFVTYDPDLIDGLQLAIVRVERDENMIHAISQIMEEVKEKIDQIINNQILINN